MPLNKTFLPLALPVCLAFAACAAPEPVTEPSADAALGLPEGALEAAGRIDEATLRATISFLADDLLEGRAPSTRGDRLTQRYLATRLEGLGLEPGGPDGSWLQEFDVVSIDARVPPRWTFLGPASGTSLDFRTDFIAASGVQTEAAAVSSAELVFVGYGIQAPEFDWDDYKGVDLRGRILVMLNNDPDWDPNLFAGARRLYYGRWDYKYESAARQGAAAAIIVHTTPSAGYGFQVVQSSWTGPQFELPAGDEPRCQIEAWLTEEAARRIVALGRHDLDELIAAARTREFEPVPLGVITSLSLDNTIVRSTTANVAGLLPGSDGALADEVVVFTAHHDHLGVGEPNASGDSIYNGAMDNASGVAQILAAAEAAAALPAAPRRSLLFLFVAAEEQGLLGSEYFARHPTFAPGRIAANVNLDGGNVWGRTTDVTFIGYGKSSLDAVVERFAARQDRTVQGDQFADRGFFYRSDQFNFARIGVPAIYLDTGTSFRDRPEGWGRERIEAWEAEHYHQPSDEPAAEWTLEGMIEDARLAFFAGLAIAEAEEAPTWNRGDEFELARSQALAALASP